MRAQPFTPFCWKHRWTMVKDVQRFGWRCPISGCDNFATREAVHRFGWDWGTPLQPFPIVVIRNY